MSSLQYVIDTICAKFTDESVYKLVKLRLEHGPFTVEEILPLIQANDHSLDSGSAKMITEAALADLAQRGDIKIQGEHIFPAR